MASSQVLPLPALLSRVLGHLTDEAEAAAGVGTGMPSLAVWSNVLRPVAAAGPDGIDERGLSGAARISRRLATAATTGATRAGWISTERAGTKNRQLRLSETGRAAADTWPAALAALDRRWRSSPLRRHLDDLVGRLPFELPHHPASYGAADPSAIGGPFVDRSKRTGGDPPHGVDWSPVRRADADTVSSLPITALLSQALVAFTIDYESGFPWPLASTATVLRHLAAEPIPLADVPGDHGITGNGKSLLERHLIAAVTRDPADGRTKLVALTGRGTQVVQHHPARLEAVEADWRSRFGDGTVSGLRSELEPLATGQAGDQPDHVIAPLDKG